MKRLRDNKTMKLEGMLNENGNMERRKQKTGYRIFITVSRKEKGSRRDRRKELYR